jgi:MFS family permease
MSVIVYACALVGINLFARIADKTDRRGLPLIAACMFASLGYVLLLIVTNLKARMAATCILAFGIFATIPLTLTWLTTNIAGYTQRGSASAIMNMVAQAFAISGNQAYTDPPLCKSFTSTEYLRSTDNSVTDRRGISSALGLTIAHMVACGILIWVINRENAAKIKVRDGLTPDELVEKRAESWDIVGDDHIDFKYGL